MPTIQSGATSDLLTIDPTSKAARATLYDSSGNELVVKPTEGSFVAQVLLRQSAATAANSLVWSLFNTNATKKLRVRSIRLMILFDGTAAAATTRAYYLQRTKTAAPTGGTAIVPSKKRTADAASIADVRFVDTGLTVGSLVTEGTQNTDAFMKIAMPISATGGVQQFPLPLHLMAERLIAPIELGQNEGIGVYLNENTTVGLGLAGAFEWDETTS